MGRLEKNPEVSVDYFYAIYLKINSKSKPTGDKFTTISMVVEVIPKLFKVWQTFGKFYAGD